MSILFSLFLLSAIDSFVLGIDYLKEFGARPVNLFLIGFFLLEVVRGRSSFTQASSRGPHVISIRARHVALSFIVLAYFVSSINFFGAARENPYRSPYISWALQSLMLFWMVSSFWLWKFVWKNVDWNWRDLTLGLGAAIGVIIIEFVYEYFTGDACQSDTLGLIRSASFCDRPSSLSSEPSLLASWLNVATAILLLAWFKTRHKFALLVIVLAILVGFYSGARTFLVVLLLQFLLFLFPGRYSLLAILLTLSFSTFFVNLEPFDMSVLTRLSAYQASVRAITDHFAFGVGVGQFDAYLNDYTNYVGLRSTEIQLWISGEYGMRASTYNIFSRIWLEMGAFGIIGFIWFIYSYLSEIDAAAVASKISPMEHRIMYVIMFGGIGFWATQDHYGYAPAVLAITFCHELTRQRGFNA